MLARIFKYFFVTYCLIQLFYQKSKYHEGWSVKIGIANPPMSNDTNLIDKTGDEAVCKFTGHNAENYWDSIDCDFL